MKNILTIDVEDHAARIAFQPYLGHREIESDSSGREGLSYVLGVLEREGIRASFFIPGDLAERHPSVVQTIMAKGHEIGSHSYHHKPMRGIGETELQWELSESLRALRSAGAAQVLGFRAPQFSLVLSNECVKLLSRLGFRYDSSVFPAWMPSYGAPSAPCYPYRLTDDDESTIWELPLSCIPVGPLQLPLKPRYMGHRATSMAVRRLNSRNAPAVILFHTWEFAATPSFLAGKVPATVRRLRDFGIPCRRLFESLLRDHEFMRADEWLAEEAESPQ